MSIYNITNNWGNSYPFTLPVANTSVLGEWIDNEKCFGIDYPISSDQLANLIKKVIGKKVGNVTLRDWDEVADEMLRVYQEC